MRSLNAKITLAFVLVTLVSTAFAAIFIQWRTQSAFNRFLTAQTRTALAISLAKYYQQKGSWEGVEDIFYEFDLEKTPNLLLVDAKGQLIIGKPPEGGLPPIPSSMESGTALEVNGRVVGWLLVSSSPAERLAPWEHDIPQKVFLENVDRALLLSTLGTVILALILGGLLARSLTHPLRELSAATRQIAQGKFGEQVPVRSNDELGQLTDSFNHMSTELEKSARLRKQMTADIAHDLRTPLSIIRGYAEALNDGKLPGSTEIYTNMHEAAAHLTRLVEDLRTLSLTDAGELALNRLSIAPEALLKRALDPFQAQAAEKGISLRLQVAPGLSEISVDPERMTQVLFNLLSNALRHTPAGGQVTCSAESQPGAVLLHVQDNGSGIASEDLPNIFQRFYRQDKSRQQDG
ncbi:MAG: HAMP domain-containing protein, partial [Anaerolineales bacterium]|nr:HAMP domain-containing protein [Anaerolineales bacterium]